MKKAIYEMIKKGYFDYKKRVEKLIELKEPLNLMSFSEYLKKVKKPLLQMEPEKLQFAYLDWDQFEDNYGDEEWAHWEITAVVPKVCVHFDKYEEFLRKKKSEALKAKFQEFLALHPDKYQTVRAWTEEDIQSRGDALWYQQCVEEANRDFKLWLNGAVA